MRRHHTCDGPTTSARVHGVAPDAIWFEAHQLGQELRQPAHVQQARLSCSPCHIEELTDTAVCQ
jgi:hypothetical protein